MEWSYVKTNGKIKWKKKSLEGLFKLDVIFAVVSLKLLQHLVSFASIMFLLSLFRLKQAGPVAGNDINWLFL